MIWLLVLLVVLVAVVVYLAVRRRQPSRLDFWHTGRGR